MFLIQGLRLMAKISGILGKETDQGSFASEAQAALAVFQAVFQHARTVVDQTGYWAKQAIPTPSQSLSPLWTISLDIKEVAPHTPNYIAKQN
jgi:hypothetical protein